MLRGPRHRWWRPLLALLLVTVFVVVAMNLLVAVLAVVGLAVGVSNPLAWVTRQISAISDLGPVGFLYLNLALMLLIPSSMFAIWIAHRVRPRFVSSVQGGLRWNWLLRCAMVVIPLWTLYLGFDILVQGRSSSRPDQWLLLLGMVIFLTPLQAAGEEYFFRGLMTQTVGSWFRRPWLALVVPTAISTVAFAGAHGSLDPWVFSSLAVFALTASILTWRTGGLEAAIAIHAVNNVGVFVTVMIVGGWDEAFVGTETQGTVWQVIQAVLVHAAALLLILRQARRAGITREYQPRVISA
ncbi:MAG TPA: CPBP family intramembrane glutamic endopeptidase [Propionibacteriaceae bacterium]|nr:CPBP family intramembrane glutamic endopeptidase [Propionibacteriaceae bacterium]